MEEPSVKMTVNDEGKDYPVFYTVIGDETGQISLEDSLFRTQNNAYLLGMNMGYKVRVIGAYTYYKNEDEPCELTVRL
ncbi:MAG TPA: hypothetical protein VKA95_02935 [Nitrososphaeraceae archaeon]|nr:hypothetical protein [Nitrososphaeraceae archaeon]